MARPEKSKRFKYRLKTVLKVRDIREKQAQDKFHEALKAAEEEKRKEDEVKAVQNQQYMELSDIMSGKSDVGMTDMQQVMVRTAHLDVLKVKVVEQEKKREEADKEKEVKREELVHKIKEKKIIEIDKENKREEWKKFMDKEEGKFLDDISSVGFERRRSDY
ncbi:MAG: hypothetical protein GY730_08905 [bacterium]|nr:hypothetical protein [bacterium]